jgi:hypothetical protein
MPSAVDAQPDDAHFIGAGPGVPKLTHVGGTQSWRPDDNVRQWLANSAGKPMRDAVRRGRSAG